MIYRAQPAREGTGSGPVVLALTNRIDMLDRALLRPGLFDRQITVTLPAWEEALVCVQLGARRPLVISEIDQRIIATHESGRAAEELAFGPDQVTTGAEDDLRAVTAIAWRMITHWGMGKKVGAVFAAYYEVESVALSNQAVARVEPPVQGKTTTLEHVFTSTMPRVRSISSPSMMAVIDGEVQRILDEGRNMAYLVLSEHYEQITHLVAVLMEQEQPDRAQFEAVIEGVTVPA